MLISIGQTELWGRGILVIWKRAVLWNRTSYDFRTVSLGRWNDGGSKIHRCNLWCEPSHAFRDAKGFFETFFALVKMGRYERV